SIDGVRCLRSAEIPGHVRVGVEVAQPGPIRRGEAAQQQPRRLEPGDHFFEGLLTGNSSRRDQSSNDPSYNTTLKPSVLAANATAVACCPIWQYATTVSPGLAPAAENIAASASA